MLLLSANGKQRLSDNTEGNASYCRWCFDVVSIFHSPSSVKHSLMFALLLSVSLHNLVSKLSKRKQPISMSTLAATREAGV